MRYVYLLGAPKSGKTQVAKKLAATLGASRIVDLPTTSQRKQLNYPLGKLSDYRIETYIGSMRALESMKSCPKNDGLEWLILVNSPLTNLVYASTILYNIVQYTEPAEEEIEQWLDTTAYLWRVCQDTVWNDKFFFLTGNDGTEFGADVEIGFKDLLTYLQFDYTTLDGKVLQKYDKAAKILST